MISLSLKKTFSEDCSFWCIAIENFQKFFFQNNEWKFDLHFFFRHQFQPKMAISGSFMNIFRKIFRCWSAFSFHWNNPSEFLENVDYYWSISIAFENLETIILQVNTSMLQVSSMFYTLFLLVPKIFFLGARQRFHFQNLQCFSITWRIFSPRLFFNGNCILPFVIQLR